MNSPICSFHSYFFYCFNLLRVWYEISRHPVGRLYVGVEVCRLPAHKTFFLEVSCCSEFPLFQKLLIFEIDNVGNCLFRLCCDFFFMSSCFQFGDFLFLSGLGWPISLFVCLLAHSIALVLEMGPRNYEVISISFLWVFGVGFSLRGCSCTRIVNNAWNKIYQILLNRGVRMDVKCMVTIRIQTN